MRLRARNGATTRQFLLGIIAVAVHLATTTLFVAAGCCDTCLAQTDASHAVITYDPLIHDQCSVVKGICCYECAFSHGNVNFGDGVTFDDDNNAVATAGTPITFQFNGVSRVTYDFLRENQKKTSFVGNQSTQADKSGDVFSICVKTAGTIAFRGWGTDSCKQVTTETTVTVKTAADGASAGTCAAVATVKPADTSGSSDSPSPSSSKTPTPNQSVDSLGTDTSTSTSGKYDVKNCNLNRGSVISTSDGTKICECAGDWRNPPACDEYSWTKTILTIAGAVATVLSIVISVRAYMKSRKSKSATEDNDVDVDDRVSEEVLRIDRRSPSKVPTPSSTRTSTSTAANTKRSPDTALGDMTRVKTVRETTL